MLVTGGLCYRRLVDDGESLVSRKVHRLLRVPPTGSSASAVFHLRIETREGLPMP